MTTNQLGTNGMSVNNEDGGNASRDLNDALQRLFPHFTTSEINTVSQLMVTYLASGIREGWNLALLKDSQHGRKLKVLRLVEEKAAAAN